MDASKLLGLWERNNDRPTFVRNHRDEIGQYTNTDEPIPDTSNYAVRQWLQRYKPTVTRQLKEAADETSDGSDEPDGDND